MRIAFAFFILNSASDCGAVLLASLGSVACAPGVSCNEMSGNGSRSAIPDARGSSDLGAYEMRPITDRNFAEGFGDIVSLLNCSP